MMDIRKRIFMVVGIVVGIVLSVLLLYMFFFKSEQAPETDRQAEPVTAEQEVEQIDRDVREQMGRQMPSETRTEPYSEDIYVKQMARIFVERFGTYSNQNDNRHVEDTLPLVTDKMAAWMNTQREEQSVDYRGVTTRVIASRVLSLTDTMAELELEAQRITETADSQEVENLSGTIDLIKQYGEWKVDGLYWK